MAPSAITAHACLSPIAMSRTSVKPGTIAGERRPIFVPSPSTPKAFEPHT
jgi:hypothetical protein